MIIDGKALQRAEIQRLAQRGALSGRTLGVVVGTSDPVTQSYVKIKKRVAAELGITVVESNSLADVATCDGIIIQLPVAPGIDAAALIAQLDPQKDVDILSPVAYEQFLHGAFPPPPVPRAMKYILDAHSIDARGKKVVIVGQGRLVGKPAADMFHMLGADVSILELGADVSVLRTADIIVLGAGDPHFLKPDMITAGVIILDAGTSEMSGSVVGDADPACADRALLFTPVPGGIGPLAVAHIFSNMESLLASA